MKQLLFIFLILYLNSFAFSQKKQRFEKAPKDMVFCPQGSYETEISEDYEYFKNRTVSIDAFWISREITNKQFREFYNFVINNPDDSLFWIDFSQIKKKTKRYSFEPDSQQTDQPKYDRNIFIKFAKCSEIKDEIIHFDIWLTDEEKIQYKNYFIDSKFNDYPVLGVTYEGARLYCIWRSQIENKINEEKALPFIQDYRIPTEYEWEYASKKFIILKEKVYEGLHSVKKDHKKKLFLNTMGDNVTEWTVKPYHVNKTKKAVVRGGSHKTEWTTEKREFMNPKHFSNDIGFRIVRSYLGFEANSNSYEY